MKKVCFLIMMVVGILLGASGVILGQQPGPASGVGGGSLGGQEVPKPIPVRPDQNALPPGYSLPPGGVPTLPLPGQLPSPPTPGGSLGTQPATGPAPTLPPVRTPNLPTPLSGGVSGVPAPGLPEVPMPSYPGTGLPRYPSSPLPQSPFPSMGVSSIPSASALFSDPIYGPYVPHAAPIGAVPGFGMVQPTVPTAVYEKPFSDYTPPQPYSPYMNLYRFNPRGPIDNYYSLVRPFVLQNTLNQQYRQRFQSVEMNNRLQQTIIQRLQQQNQIQQGTYQPGYYMNHGSFFPGY